MFVELSVDTNFDLCTANLSLQFLVDLHDLFIVMVSITVGSTVINMKNTYYSFLIDPQQCSKTSQKFNEWPAFFKHVLSLLISLNRVVCLFRFFSFFSFDSQE